MAEPKLKKVQLTVGAPVDTLLVTPQSVPTDTVQVSGANIVMSDDITIKPFVGGNSASFALLPMGQVSRWDLLSLDISGVNPLLAIDEGTIAATLQNFQDSIPTIPADKIPLAAILVTEAAPGGTVIIIDTDIVDIRGYFHRVQHPAGSVAYVPNDAGDWIVVPSDAGNALDELADRLNQGTAPPDINPTIALAGTSKIASRDDHVHKHGDLSGSATTHHDGVQIEFTPDDLTNWEGGVDPGKVKDALDQLADRTPFGGLLSNVEVGGRFLAANVARIRDFVGWVAPGGIDILSNIGKRKFISLGSSFSATLSVSGAGGLDTGAAAADTWYFIYLITEADGTNPALVFSTSSGGPSFPSIGAPYVDGLFRHVGFAKTLTGSSTVFLVCYYSGGNCMYYDEDADLTISTTAPPTPGPNPFVDVSAVNGIPPFPGVSGIVLGRFSLLARDNGGSGPDEFFMAPGGTTGSTGGKKVVSIQSGGVRADQMAFFEMMTDLSQAIAHRATGAINAGYELRVVGFYVPIF